MGIDKELIDKLLENYKSPEEIVGENGLLKQLTKLRELLPQLHQEIEEHLANLVSIFASWQTHFRRRRD